MIMRPNAQRGSTLIEVIIATAVVTLVLTGIMAGLTLSIKNTAEAKYKTLATSLAQEGMEAFRRERDIQGWETFQDVLNAQTYCLSTVPDSLANLNGGVCSLDEDIAMAGVSLYREAIVTVNTPADPVRVQIKVRWNSGDRERDVMLSQDFQGFE